MIAGGVEGIFRAQKDKNYVNLTVPSRCPLRRLNRRPRPPGAQREPVHPRDAPDVLGRHPGIHGQARPFGHRGHHLVHHAAGGRSLEPGDRRKAKQVVALEPLTLAGEAHLVLARPGSVSVVRVRDVVGGREPPRAAPVHQEREVLHMVVLVPGHHVEHGPADLLFDLAQAETEQPDRLDRLLVRIGPGDVVVEMP